MRLESAPDRPMEQKDVLNRITRLNYCELLETVPATEPTPDFSGGVFRKVQLDLGETDQESLLVLEKNLLKNLQDPYLLSDPESSGAGESFCLQWQKIPSLSLREVFKILSKRELVVENQYLMLRLVLDVCSRAGQVQRYFESDGPIGFTLAGGNFDNVRLAEDGRLFSIGFSDLSSEREFRVAPTHYSQTYPPEILVPGQRLTEKAELFAAGILLFNAAVSKPLISTSKADDSLIYRLFMGVHPRIAEFYPKLQPLDSVMRQAIDWFPDRRQQGLDEFNEELATLIDALFPGAGEADFRILYDQCSN